MLHTYMTYGVQLLVGSLKRIVHRLLIPYLVIVVDHCNNGSDSSSIRQF